MTHSDQRNRCAWVNHDSLLYRAYHDQEWGVPIHDDRLLFEFLILEGAQAGLSWLTVLKKRDHYRRAFDDFDADKIAVYDGQKFAALMQDAGIVRNRLKIQAAIANAQALLRMREQGLGFSDFIWSFVDQQPIKNHWRSPQEVPATSAISDRLAKALKARGFSFVGSTICYAFMQAVGMVNDHTTDCYCYVPTLPDAVC